MSNEKIIRCCICGKYIKEIEGNNPWPVIQSAKKQCCNMCNLTYVIPCRMTYYSNNHHALSIADEVSIKEDNIS